MSPLRVSVIIEVRFFVMRHEDTHSSLFNSGLGVDIPQDVVYNPYVRLNQMERIQRKIEKAREAADLARYDVITPGQLQSISKPVPARILGTKPRNLQRLDMALADPINPHFGSAVFDRLPYDRETKVTKFVKRLRGDRVVKANVGKVNKTRRANIAKKPVINFTKLFETPAPVVFPVPATVAPVANTTVTPVAPVIPAVNATATAPVAPVVPAVNTTATVAPVAPVAPVTNTTATVAPVAPVTNTTAPVAPVTNTTATVSY